MTHDEICRSTAEKFEKKVAQIYISSTVEAVLFEIAAIFVIFFKAGFSSFTLMQAIGISLMILFVISVIIFWRKKRLRKDMLKSLEQDNIDKDSFVDFIKQTHNEFEFIHALLIKQVKN